MSLIRRLGDKARQAKEAQEAEDLAKQRLNERFANVIAPSMEGLYRYLNELIEQIKLVREAFPIRYELTGYGAFEALSTFDYKLEREQRYRGVTLDLVWKVRVNPERSPVITLNGYDRIKALDEIFKRWGLGGAQGDKRAPSGLLIQANFQPRGFICCRLNVVANAEDEFVRFTFENVDRLGTTRKLLPPEQLDEAACDRLARFLVREDDDFIREDLPEHLRQRLRPSAPTPATTPAPEVDTVTGTAARAATDAASNSATSSLDAPTSAARGSVAPASSTPGPNSARGSNATPMPPANTAGGPPPQTDFELPESTLDPRLRAGFLRAIAPAEARDAIDADLQASLAEAARKAEEALRQAMREHGFEPESSAPDAAAASSAESEAVSPVIPVALPEPDLGGAPVSSAAQSASSSAPASAGPMAPVASGARSAPTAGPAPSAAIVPTPPAGAAPPSGPSPSHTQVAAGPRSGAPVTPPTNPAAPARSGAASGSPASVASGLAAATPPATPAAAPTPLPAATPAAPAAPALGGGSTPAAMHAAPPAPTAPSAPATPTPAAPPAPQRDKASAFLNRFKKTLDQLDES